MRSAALTSGSRPGQPALAHPFAHPDDVDGHEHHQKTAGDIGGAGAKGINHGPGQGSRHGDADHLPAGRQRATHRALFLRQDIDRQAIDRDILKHGGGVDREADDAEDQNVVRPRIDESKGDQQGDHHRLRANDPHPPSTHRQQSIAVHDEAGDKLEAPGDAHHRHDKGNIRRRSPVNGHPGRDCKIEQAERNALPGIKKEYREQPQVAVFGQRKRRTQAGRYGETIHAISPDRHQGDNRPLPEPAGAAGAG